MAGGSRRQLQLGQGLALGVSLVSGRILMRLCLAELDLVVIVQHRSGRLLRFLGNDIDHQAALLGDFPDIGFGGIGLAQTVLKSEPLMLAPYEVAFVQDSSCGAGKVLKVTGTVRGVQRRKACVTLASEQASLVSATP